MRRRVSGAGAPTRCKGKMNPRSSPLRAPQPFRGGWASQRGPGPAPSRAAQVEAYLWPGYLNQTAAGPSLRPHPGPGSHPPSLPPQRRAWWGPRTPPMGPRRGDGPLRGRTARGGPVRAPPLDPGLPACGPLLPASGARPAGPRRTDPGGGAAGRGGEARGGWPGALGPAPRSPSRARPAAWVAPPRHRAGAVPRPPGSQVLTARRRRPGRRPPVHMASGQRPRRSRPAPSLPRPSAPGAGAAGAPLPRPASRRERPPPAPSPAPRQPRPRAAAADSAAPPAAAASHRGTLGRCGA